VSTGITRDVSLDYQPSTRALRKVSGPVVGDSVNFGLHPSVAGVVTSRTNRRRDGTTYSYEAGLLSQVSIDMSRTSDPAITTTFCPAEATTLIPCASKPVSAALVRTRYDGPRNDIADTTQFFLTSFGAPRLIVDALGRRTTLSRGLPAWPLLVTRVDRPGGGVDSTEYRADRALVSRTLTSASAGRTAVTHVVWHDTLALVKTITSPEGEVTTFTYDAAGNRKTEKRGTSKPRWTVYDYDAQNRVIAAFDSGAAPGNASRFHYDADLGNLDSTQSPTGIISRLFRDAIGRVTVAKTPIDVAQTYFTTAETRFDLMDRDTVTYTTGPRVVHGSDNVATYSMSLTDTLVVRTKYNAEGYPEEVARVVVAPNPNGLNALVTKNSYDAVHRVRETTAPDNAKEQFFYNDGVNLKSMYNRNGQFIQMSYDALNRLKTRTLPGATRDDNVGALGSLTIAPDVETFDYDAFGFLSHAKNAAADVFRDYNVDGTLRHELQRVASATGSLGQHDYDLEYTYDLQGRRLTNTHPWQSLRHLSGGGATYRYNEHGELDRITTGFNETFSYFYDRRGRLDSLAYPNGIREIHQYDDDGREILSLHRAPSATLGWHTDFRENTDTIQAARLERDATGRVITATQYDLNVLKNGYTAHGALKWSQRPRPTLQNAPEVETYEVDPLGNLKQSTFSGTGFSGGFHRYDITTGRLLGIDRTNNDPNDFNQTSWYDAAGNQYRSARSAIVPSLNESSNTNLVTDALFASDATGRQRFYKERARTGSDTLVYPAEKFVDQETRYDALGRRVWMNTKHMDKNASECGDYCYTQRFVWDGNQLLAEFRFPDSLAEMDTMLVYNLVQSSTEVLDPPPPWKQYSWLYGQTMYQHGLGIDAPLAVYRGGLGRDSVDLSGMRMYPHHDWRGNATAVSFETATPTFGGGSGYYTPPLLTDLNKDLTAYGARTNGGRQVTSWVGSLLIGQRDASGLQYRRNRYYDPQSGRFTQEDPIGLAGGMNLYGFAGGDPVNFSDPFGLCPQWLTGKPCSGAVDLGAGLVPGLSTGIDVATAASGQNPLTGQSVGIAGRLIAVAGVFTPASGGQIRALGRIGSKLLNQLSHVDRRHLSIAARELRGLETGWDHVTEVQDAMNGLRNTIRQLNGVLGDPNLTDEARQSAQALLGRASRALDRAEDALRPR
jgi:RHS repeat-associated protein